MAQDVSSDEAKAALDEVERGRRRVVDEIDLPGWYWWGVGLGWIAVGLATDLGGPWLAGGATLLFGAVHASVFHQVGSGRHRSARLSVRADVVGRHATLLVLVGLVGLGLLTTAGGWAASADGAGHPVTTASVVVAVLVVLGGPRLMTVVRRRVDRSSVAP